MADPVLLFVQRRPARTGAQVALSHILAHPEVRGLRPALLTSDAGWLTGEADRLGVPRLTLPFPTSRSLSGRLFGNRQFARSVLAGLEARGLTVAVVVGNDHPEGLIVGEIARQAGCPSAIVLRSSGMTRRDFHKYGCDRIGLIYAAGDELTARASGWLGGQPVATCYDGVSWGAFHDVKAKATTFPVRILVIGSAADSKGWQDVAAAVDMLEHDPGFPRLTLDFTGNLPRAGEADMRLDRRRRSEFCFIGRTTDFLRLLRQYDLVLHPSRRESVGLAMLEAVAAGVPLLTSRVGVAGMLGKSADWLFEPENPESLARSLRHLWKDWTSIASDAAASQEKVRERFIVDRTLLPLARDLRSLKRNAMPAGHAAEPVG